MSKWGADATTALNDVPFLICMRLSRLVSSPLDHFRRVLQHHKMYVKETGSGSLAQLVWSKGAAIMAEYNAMADTSFETADWCSFFDDLPIGTVRK
eukprot:1953534-Pyramimonas_sp.AAC.1